MGPGAGRRWASLVSDDHALRSPEHRDRRGQQAVVGAEQGRPFRLDGDESSRRPDAGVDDGEHDGGLGEVLDRPHQRERTGAHVVGRKLVGEVDDRQVGGDAEHDALAHADELVPEPVVRQESDRERHDS